MTQETLIQSNFSGGEISPRLIGRSDLDRYYTSTSELTNMIVGRAGNLFRRPGSTYISNAFGAGSFNLVEGTSGKLFSWQRDVDDGFVAAYSGNDITLFKNGSQLTNTFAQSTQVGSATRVMFTDANLGFESDNPQKASFASVADIAYFAPYPEGEQVSRLYSIQLKKGGVDENVFTDRLNVGANVFAAQSAIFTDGPYEKFNTDETAELHFATKRSISTPIESHPLDGHGTHNEQLGTEVGDFGWLIYSDADAARVHDYLEEQLNITIGSGETVYPFTDRLICLEQVNPDTEKIERGVGRIFCIGTELVPFNGYRGIGIQIVQPFIVQDDTNIANRTFSSAFAVSIPFHEGFNAFTFHQDRFYFSVKNKPNRIYASSTAGYSVPKPNLDFDMASKPDGSLTSNGFAIDCSPSDRLDVLNVRDTDGLDFGLTAGELGDITEMISDARGLLAFTEAEAFLVSGGGALAAITPTNVIGVRQSNFGLELGTKAVQADSSVLFVQDGGLVLRETGYDFSNDRYLSRNLSFLAEHLMKSNSSVSNRRNITELVLQRSPEARFLLRRDDGKSINLSYQPTEGLVAFSKIEFGTATSTDSFDAGLKDNPPLASEIVSQTVLREDNTERLYQLVRRRKATATRADGAPELNFEVVIGDRDFGLQQPIEQLFLDSKTKFDNRIKISRVEMFNAELGQLRLFLDLDNDDVMPNALGSVVVCRGLDGLGTTKAVPARFANTRYTIVSIQPSDLVVQIERGGSFDASEFSLPATNLQATVGELFTQLSGLTRFEGASVSVCQGEELLGSFTVSSGQIDLRQDTNLNPVRTEHLLSDVVTVGLPYTSRIKTVPVATLRSGTSTVRDIRSDQTRIYKLFLRLLDSFGGSAGGIKTTPILYRTNQNFTNAPFRFSGVLEHNIVDSSELGTTVQVETTDPYNFEITSMYMQVDRGGIS